jgi:hypothetical protein
MAATAKVALSNKTIIDSVVGATATASLSTATNGQLSSFTLNNGGTVNYSGEWYTQLIAGIGAGYEIQVAVNSGTTPSGSAVGSFLSLNTARSWSLTRSTAGTTTCNATVTIRVAGGGATVATMTLVLTATRI